MQVEVWNSNSQMVHPYPSLPYHQSNCKHLPTTIHFCHIIEQISYVINKLKFPNPKWSSSSIYFSSIVMINLYIPPEKGTTSRPGLHFYRTATAAPAPRAPQAPRSRQLPRLPRPRKGHCRRCGKCWRRCSTTWRRRSWSWDFSCHLNHLGEIHGTSFLKYPETNIYIWWL